MTSHSNTPLCRLTGNAFLRAGARVLTAAEEPRFLFSAQPARDVPFCCSKNGTIRLGLAGFAKRHNTGRNAGFTLLEMLVVTAVMGLAMLLIAGYGQPHSRWLETQAAARQVAEAMRDARGLAVTHDQPVALVMPYLPAWLAVSVEAPPGGIVFSPDGSASGGRVVLGGTPSSIFPPNGTQKTITVSADWLTGRVQIDAP